MEVLEATRRSNHKGAIGTASSNLRRSSCCLHDTGKVDSDHGTVQRNEMSWCPIQHYLHYVVHDIWNISRFVLDITLPPIWLSIRSRERLWSHMAIHRRRRTGKQQASFHGIHVGVSGDADSLHEHHSNVVETKTKTI